MPSRKATREFAEGREEPIGVTPEQIREYLGSPRFEFEEVQDRVVHPGVATGLFYTPMGGGILFIEAMGIPDGKGNLTLTGQLGNVMRESAQAALSWVRAHASEFGIASDFFQKNDVHVHVPAGAVPKDGPSAGVAMACSIASLGTGRKLRARVAMTGEITLTGRVLPVGGIKEKVLAARRAGIRQVIVPERNRKDVDEDVPDNVKESLTFHFVSEIREVIELALENPGGDPVPLPNGADGSRRKAAPRRRKEAAVAR